MVGQAGEMIFFFNYKVQPDVEELTQNMEDNQDAESKKSEVQFLGKLQFTLDYEFQKQEVCFYALFHSN
jgi:hypothetical protein